MTLATTHQQTTTAPPLLLDKAFFGKDTCLNLQLRGGTCFIKWGKKAGTAWEWKNVKFSDHELGELILVLEGKKSSCNFFHSFNNESTQIKFEKRNNELLCSASGHARKLREGEQTVLRVLLQNCIWMMNLPQYT